jgi:hypothetical protein
MAIGRQGMPGVFFLVLLGCSQAVAHEVEPPQDVRAGCRSATDGCRICKLDEHGVVVGCSFPGTACEVTAWTCNVRNERPEAAGPKQPAPGASEPAHKSAH